MIETELSNLEAKIDALIELLQKMKLENSALRKKITHLSNENIMLLGKKKKAAGSLKILITQLHDELLCQPQK